MTVIISATGFILAAAATWAILRPRLRRWGADDDELRRVWPGDDLVAEPNFSTLRAVSIAAPGEDVWPWLAQMGQGRGGFYSYDWLENLIGLDIHSADEVVGELQDLRLGERISAVPEGWLGVNGAKLPTNTVVRLEPGHFLVLRPLVPMTGGPPKGSDGTWSFIVEPDGPGHSRLLARGRCRTATGWATVQVVLQEPAHFLMERKMLLGIKARAEGRRSVTSNGTDEWAGRGAASPP